MQQFDERLQQQIRFLQEIDKLKQVVRRTYLNDGSRRENTAEHSWHMALYVAVLAEFTPKPLDVGKAILMAIVHDLVEIYAGDTFVYDVAGYADKEERENAAANKLFSLLPDEQGQGLCALWEEFEERQTPEARFVAAMDRLQPILQNFASRGKSWKEHNVRRSDVMKNHFKISEGAPGLAPYLEAVLELAVLAGYLADA